MAKRKPTPRKPRQSRRTPDARALEWAVKKLEGAERDLALARQKVYELSIEVPRLQGIIAALEPAEERAPPLSYDGKSAAQRTPSGKPRVVAGMDVSRYVNPRTPTVADPVSTDLNEDALLDVADGNLPKGTELV